MHVVECGRFINIERTYGTVMRCVTGVDIDMQTEHLCNPDMSEHFDIY